MYYEEQGMSPQEIVEQLPTITLADVHAALAFYYDNPEIIAAEEAEEAEEADEARFIEELKQRHPSRLHEMLHQRRV